MEFKQIRPRTRDERMAALDKEALEKGRLEQRREGFQRYVNNGSIVGMDPNATGYCPEAERFDTDSAYQEKTERDAAVRRKVERWDSKRTALIESEEARWAAMEQAEIDEAAKWKDIRDSGAKAKRGILSVPYDPITLKYYDTAEGQQLRNEDERIRYRAAVRARNLEDRMGAGLNPITMEQHRHSVLPPQPPPRRPMGGAGGHH